VGPEEEPEAAELPEPVAPVVVEAVDPAAPAAPAARAEPAEAKPQDKAEPYEGADSIGPRRRRPAARKEARPEPVIPLVTVPDDPGPEPDGGQEPLPEPRGDRRNRPIFK
jgi:uncharacterized membrane-anchored protein